MEENQHDGENTDPELPEVPLPEESGTPRFSPLQKKYGIVALLALCNVVAMFVLSTFEPPAEIDTADLNTIDLAIDEKLKEYNIPARQIRTENVLVDSLFTRKIIRSGVPRGISRTLLHMELNSELTDLGVRIPAVVKFPERDLNIHFMLGNTIVRTLILRSDTSIKIQSYAASLIFHTDPEPDSDALEELRRFGEAYQIAGHIERLADAEDLMSETEGINPSRLLFWVEGTEAPTFKYNRFFNELTENLKKSAPNSRLLLFAQEQTSNNRTLWKTLQQQQWQVVLATQQAVRPGNLNEEEFRLMMQRFDQEALSTPESVLILPLKASYLVWLRDILPDLKKNGLRLTERKPIKF